MGQKVQPQMRESKKTVEIIERLMRPGGRIKRLWKQIPFDKTTPGIPKRGYIRAASWVDCGGAADSSARLYGKQWK